VASYKKYVAQWYPGSHGRFYALWSPTIMTYSRAYGLQTKRLSRAWRDTLLHDPDWQLLYARDGSYLFRLRETS
jgi:hypothetical protein